MGKFWTAHWPRLNKYLHALTEPERDMLPCGMKAWKTSKKPAVRGERCTR